MSKLCLEWEINWIRENEHLYKSKAHADIVIFHITQRYRIKELEDSIRKFRDDPISKNKLDLFDKI